MKVGLNLRRKLELAADHNLKYMRIFIFLSFTCAYCAFKHKTETTGSPG